MSLERLDFSKLTPRIEQEISSNVFGIQELVKMQALQIRFETHLLNMITKYPQLESLLIRQLDVPQIGEYHNEGDTMYSHLLLIFKTLEDLLMGKFHSSVSNPALRQILSKLVDDNVSVNSDLIEYMFLHDLSKMDSLILTIEGEEQKHEISAEQWLQISSQKPFIFNDKSVESIGYFHRSQGREGMHGYRAVKLLESLNLGISQEILSAIDKHEVAYQFGKISARSYINHIVDAGFDSRQQDFILVASYIDTMGSLRSDLEPDLTNFLNLYFSRLNFETISRFQKLHPEVAENKINRFYNSDKVVHFEDLSVLLPKVYSPSQLTQLQILLEDCSKFSDAEINQIIEQVRVDESGLGRLLGKKMKFVRPILNKL